MRNLLRNRRLLVILVVIAIVFIGVKIKRDGGLELIIPSKFQDQAKETVFVQVAKQFALTIPAKWSVTELVSGKQTLIYPAGTQMSSTDVQTLLNQNIVIVETAINKKESFEALIATMKSNAEKGGSTVSVEDKNYGALKASKMTIKGKTNYQQVFFNTPTLIILTAKIDHLILDDLAKSVTIDLSGYANDITQVTNLTQQTKQDIATGNFSNIYKTASDGLKKQKNETDFGNTLKGVSGDFNDNILVWGIFINSNGLGSAINITNQDKVIRRGSFYYTKIKDKYLLDAIRISGKITPSPTTPSADATQTKTN